MPSFRICSYFSFFWWWMPSILFWHCFPLRGLASTQALTLIPSVMCSCSSVMTMPVHWWVANSHGMLRAGGSLTRTFQSGHAFPTQGKLWLMRLYIKWPWLCQIFLKRVISCLFKMTMAHSWYELPGYRADCHLMQPRPAVSRVWKITRSQTLQNGCCETCLNPIHQILGNTGMFSPCSEMPAWSREFAWANRALGMGLGALLLGRRCLWNYRWRLSCSLCHDFISF